MHVNKLFDLSGKTALITGGAGHKYGAQIAAALAEAGAQVFITSRKLDKAVERAKEYRNTGLQIEGLELNFKNDQEIVSLIKNVINRAGKIDILVNNACTNQLEPFESISPEEWDRVFFVNVTAPMLLTRAVAPFMLESGKGAVINVSSIYGVVAPDFSIYGDSGLTSPLVYGASKAALIQMTKYWAAYWAPKIRVNAITPGGLFNDQDPEFVKNYVKKTPMGRMAGPNDLKGAALFLASDASSWITGQNLVVDGGWTIN